MPHKLFIFTIFLLNFSTSHCKANDNQLEVKILHDKIEKIYASRYPAYLDFSPDTRKILIKSLIAGQFALQIHDIKSKQNTTINLDTNGQFSPTWSHRGDKVAFYLDPTTKQDFKLYIYDLRTAQIQPIETKRIIRAKVAWSEDDRYLSYFDKNNGLNIVDLQQAGKLVYSTINGVGPELQISWSRTSNSIAHISFSNPNIIEVYNVTEGKSFKIDIGRKVKIFNWSSTSEKLVVVSTANNQSFIELVTESSSTPIPINISGDIVNVLPSFDDKTIVFAIDQGFDGKYAIYRTGDKSYKEYPGDAIDIHHSKNMAIVYIDEKYQKGLGTLNLSSLKGQVLLKSQNSRPNWALSEEFTIDIGNQKIPCLIWKTKGKNHPIVIHVHGGPAAHHGSNWKVESEVFLKSGIDLLLLNYSGSTGYGEEYLGQVNRAVSDTVNTIRYLHETRKYSEIYLLGYSFGTHLVLEASHQEQNLVAGLFLTSHLGNAANFSSLPKKLLVFHGENDYLHSPDYALSDLQQYWNTTRSDWFKIYNREGHSFRRVDTYSDLMTKIIWEIIRK